MINLKPNIKLNKTSAEKTVIGIFIDSRQIKAICLTTEQQKIRLLDAIQAPFSTAESIRSDKVNSTNEVPDMQSAPVGIALAEDATNGNGDTMIPDLDTASNREDNTGILDISNAIDEISTNDDGIFTDEEPERSPFIDFLNQFSVRKIKFAITITEPGIFYNYFETDWGLSGKKLKQRIITEISKERPDAGALKPEAIHLLKLANESLLAIVREPESGLQEIVEDLRQGLRVRTPSISIVETAEISLVNLTKKLYPLNDDDISVIISTSQESTRLIFLKGNELLFIAPPIGEGLDSFAEEGFSPTHLATTTRNRLLLEQDSLNIDKINNIFLSGAAAHLEFRKVLKSYYSKEMRIEPLKLKELRIRGLGSLQQDSGVHLYDEALATAMSILMPDPNYLLDLIPSSIREEQKVFKLSAIGWVLFSLIPILTFLLTAQITKSGNKLKQLTVQTSQKKSELAYLKEIDQKVEVQRKTLNYYVNTFGVLDSMVVGTHTWSAYMQKIAKIAEEIGGVWITEVLKSGPDGATIKGYSTKREKIPRFADSFDKSTLQQVQIQESRNKTIYTFRIDARVPETRPEFARTSDLPPVLDISHDPDILKILEQDFSEITTAGIQLYKEFKLKEARTEFEKLSTSNTTIALKSSGSFWAGVCSFGLHDFNQAREYLKKAGEASKSANHAKIYYMRGWVEAKSGNRAQAEKYFNLVLTDEEQSIFSTKSEKAFTQLTNHQ